LATFGKIEAVRHRRTEGSIEPQTDVAIRFGEGEALSATLPRH
jgi:hypothetical protein